MTDPQDIQEARGTARYQLRALFYLTAAFAVWFALTRHVGLLLLVWPLSIPIGFVVGACLRFMTRGRWGTPLGGMEGAATAAAIFAGLVLRNHHENLDLYRFASILFVPTVVGAVLGSHAIPASRIGIDKAMLAALRFWTVTGVAAWIVFSIQVISQNRGHPIAVFMCIGGVFIAPLVGAVFGLLYGFFWGSCRELWDGETDSL